MSDTIEIDPEEFQRHNEMAHRKAGSLRDEELPDWLASRKWLAERGLIPVKPERKRPAPVVQGLPRSGYEQRAYADQNMKAGASGPPHGKILSTRMSEVEPREVDYLWEGTVPYRMLTLFGGEGDKGKSMAALAIAATVTTGGSWPNCRVDFAEPGSVLFFCAEDRLAETIRPRLDAAGADCDRVHVATAWKAPDGHETDISFRRDLQAIEDLLTEIKDVKLLVIDPITAYLDGADENKNAEVRSVLREIDKLAERHGIAVILIAHFNKGSAGKSGNRVSASAAFVNVPRVVWYFMDHPDDDERNVMVNYKFNVGRKPKGFTYQAGADGPAIRWDHEPAPWSYKDLCRLEAEKVAKGLGDGRRGPPPRKLKEAMAEALKYLARIESTPGELRQHLDTLKFKYATVTEALKRLRASAQVEEYERDDGQKWLRKAPDLALPMNGEARP